MVPTAGRGEWRPPPARGGGGRAGHLRGRPGGALRSVVAAGVLTAGCPEGCGGFGRSWWGGRGPSQVVSCREIVKVCTSHDWYGETSHGPKVKILLWEMLLLMLRYKVIQ
ncbi:uncharacterized protein LOC144577641 [Callithrix jacchus]